MISLLFITCFALHVSATNYSRIIYVDPNGENKEDCLMNSSTPCHNLDWVFQQPQSRLSSTQFLLSEGEHIVSQPSSPFENLSSLSFKGSNSVITCTKPGTGLAFINVTSLSFEGVSFLYCEALRHSTSYDFSDNTISLFRAGLYIYYCQDLTMDHVSVSHSPNATGVVVYDTDGLNHFTDCNFTNNSFVNVYKENSSLINNDTFPGGGGFYVEFTYCRPGEVCDTPLDEKNINATYLFTRCTFSHNMADNLDTNDHSTYIIPHGTDHEAFGRGGGLSVFFKGDAHWNQITVDNCTFDSNSALWGGGMFVELHDDVWGNVISVRNTVFHNNSCPYTISEGTGGGGMRVGLYVFGQGAPSTDVQDRNDIAITGTNFTRNFALHGGGLSISPALQLGLNVAHVTLTVVQFKENVAKLGSAMNVDRFGDILVGQMAVVFFIACEFSNNSIKYAQHIGMGNTPHQVGLGTIHVDSVLVYFLVTALFEDNDGGAIACMGTTVSFRDCNATFSRNSGDKGAGISLHGAAALEIDNGTSLLFRDNVADTLGGAIYNTYIERENLKSDSNCFLHHSDPFLNPDDWNVNITFINNFDFSGNRYNAIHSTSILPCSVPGGSGIINDTNKIFCWKGWNYPDSNCTAAIASDIGFLSFSHGINISAYPGWSFDLPIIIEDDLGHEITGQSFTVKYNDTDDVVVAEKESVTVGGWPNDTIMISLNSFGQREWHLEMYVTLRECPPGFVTNDNLTVYAQCACAEGQFGGAILCDDFSHNINLLSGMWLGKVDGQYVVMDCPLNYCREENRRYRKINFHSGATHNYSSEDLGREICEQDHRSGINCAMCEDGYGIAINSASFECVECGDINLGSNIAKYVAAVYLPLALLFTILIIFDIRLTTGPANAFILYCQVVSSTFDLNADGGVPHSSGVLEAYRFPFGISNLEFIEDYISPICFGQEFISLQVFLLHYVVAVFPIFMIVVVIACLKVSETCCLKNQRLSVQQRRIFLSISRLSSLLSRNKRKNVNDALLPAFASFLLLSYTKLSTTSSYILNIQHPVNVSGDLVTPGRVYYASQYSVDSTEYLYYKVPAIVVLLFVTTLPFILLEYPLKALEWVIVRVKLLRLIYPIDKVHLFMNMFQGCYRNKMRFFAGLYFLFRLMINVSYIFTDTWLQQFLVQQATTTIMITLLALFHPYEKKYLNYVDILIFTNLAILNSISFYLYSFAKVDPNLTPNQAALNLQYVLVFLPLIYMICYLLWNTTRRYHEKIKLYWKSMWKRLRRRDYEPINSDSEEDEFQPRINSIVGKPPPRSFIDKEKEFESDFEAMMSRAEDTNTYMPSMSKSVSVVVVGDKQGEGEANVFQTRISGEGEANVFQTRISGEGEANVFQTRISDQPRVSELTTVSEDSGLRSSQSTPNVPGVFLNYSRRSQ